MCHCCPGYLFSLENAPTELFFCGFRQWYLVKAKVAHIDLLIFKSFITMVYKHKSLLFATFAVNNYISITMLFRFTKVIFWEIYQNWIHHYRKSIEILGGCLRSETVPNVVKWRNLGMVTSKISQNCLIFTENGS